MYKTGSKENDWFSQCGRTWLVCIKPSPNPRFNTSGVTVNADLSQKLITKHQWLVHMGSVILDTSKTVATEIEIQFLNTWICSIVVATDLEVHFSVLKKGVSQYFCLYSVCTSHWCLVMSFWLKVCIYSHTRGFKLGLGLGLCRPVKFFHTDWINHFLFEPCLIHRGIVMLE